jgi:Concanavalin A-like lectin/glucanases superfamily
VTRRLATLLVIVAGCGRFQFDQTDAGTDGTDDAGVDAPTAVAPIHRYRLAGTFVDDFGGPSIDPLGGGFATGGYTFAANQGLGLSNAVPVATYTIDIKFAFDQIGGYRKLLDFKALTTDEGLYVFDETLQFVIVASNTTVVTSPPLFSAGTMAEVTLTRDAAGMVTGYVNKASQITYLDISSVAEFTHAGHVANFGVDDNATGQTEASGGVISEIAIWDVALTLAEIAAL